MGVSLKNKYKLFIYKIFKDEVKDAIILSGYST